MKIYSRRDSATAVLRKAGIDKADYNKYIKVVDGGFTIEDPRFPPVKEVQPAKVHPNAAKNAKQIVNAMEAAVKSGKKSSKKPPVKVVYEEVTQPAKAYRVDPNNITNTIKSLILGGKTNAEIWGIIQPAFNMADDKRHYPAWYRSQMKRKGQLS